MRIGATGLQVPRVVVTADDVERGNRTPTRSCSPPSASASSRALPRGGGCAGRAAAAHAAGCATLAVTTTTPRHELVADAVVTDLGHVVFSHAGADIRVRPAGV